MSNPSAQNPMITALTNTTYYVSVTNTNSCTNTDSVKVDIWPDPVYKINSPASICLNDSIQLKASGGVNYEWQPSTYLNDGSIENPMAFPQNTTTYSVQISDKCNNSKILSTTITVLLRPVVEISKSNDVDCVTPVAQLEAIGGVRYTWNPGTFINSTSIANPIVYPHNNTWYKVDAYNENGCKATDSVLVLSSYADDGKFYIPNAFTPNGDGKNDCFGMKYLGEPEIFELSVFNRWGQKMYHTTNPSNCWNGLFNGTPQPAGVFIYILKVKSECISGVLEKKGFVTLIR
jgi:gliding motility-associated-like protein